MMEWKKAGRKSKSSNKHAQNEKNHAKLGSYTRKELTVIKNGELMLALSVIKQWRDDGSPDTDDISLFKDIIEHFGGRI